MPTVSSSATSSQRFAVLAPADGVMHPLSQHPSAAIRQLAGLGFCLQPTGHNLVSPCSGTASLHFLPQPCLLLRHSSGLQVRLELPAVWLERHGQGLLWLFKPGTVQAGQPLATIDPSFLQHRQAITVTVFPHPAIRSEPLVAGRTVQAQEPCFFIQLTGKNT